MARKNRGNVANGENTVIGAGTTVNGDIVSDSAVIRIDGQINGGINTKGDLVVGATGVVNGAVVASSVNLAGKIFGNVDADNKVEIEAKGQILGDITAKLLAMDETAVIKGRVNMDVPGETKADDRPVADSSSEDVKSEEKEADKED